MNLKDDPCLQEVGMEIYRNSFVTGTYNDQRLEIAYYFRPADGHLLASVKTGLYASGPPGFVHGGAISAILDETMGVMAWFNRHPVVTANLNIDFCRPLPLGVDVIVDSWIEQTDERKVFTQGEIRSNDQVFARGKGLFIRLPMDFLPEQLGEQLAKHYRLKTESV